MATRPHSRIFGDMVQDLRFAMRQLCIRPGFTLIAFAVFAFGVGASVAVFAYVDAVLLKPLPYHEPSRLVAVFERIPVGDRYHLSYSDYIDWKRLNRVFTSLDVYQSYQTVLTTATAAEEIPTVRVSDQFFRTLGVAPFLGRDFTSGEDQPNAQETVILSYNTWRSRFNAEKSVLGTSITLDGSPYVIIGVLPPEFHFAPAEPAEFWTTLHGYCADERLCHPYFGVARLKEGMTVAAAHADLELIARQIAQQYPLTNGDRGASVIPLRTLIVGDIRPILLVLLFGAGLLSFIGFVNVSGLLLVKAERQKREIAIREALGATRTRLMAQFAVEGFLLAGVGCVLALLFAYGMIKAFALQIPVSLAAGLPYLQRWRFDAPLVIFAALLSLCGGALFSLAPVLHLLFLDIQEGLAENGRSAGRSWRRMGSPLIVIELAIAMMLVLSASLVVTSFYRLVHVDTGMRTDHLAVMHVVGADNLPESHWIAIAQEIVSHLTALPGASMAAVSSQLPLGNGDGFAHFRVVGKPYRDAGDEANLRIVSAGYFQTLRAQLVKGRFFTEHDDNSRPMVAIINEVMAKQLFSTDDPVGMRIVNKDDKDSPIEIVGIVSNIQEGPLNRAPIPAIYIPFKQSPTSSFYVALRTTLPDTTVLRSMVKVVHGIDGGLIADEEKTMTDRINESQLVYLQRASAWIVANFAGLALLLGTVGLYGVVSYSVSQRTREIGVRIALGAQRPSIYLLVFKETGWLAIAGVTFGIFGSVEATSLLQSILFGVSRWDLKVLTVAVFLLLAATFLGSFIPARRAASVDPIEALRMD